MKTKDEIAVTVYVARSRYGVGFAKAQAVESGKSWWVEGIENIGNLPGLYHGGRILKDDRSHCVSTDLKVVLEWGLNRQEHNATNAARSANEARSLANTIRDALGQL